MKKIVQTCLSLLVLGNHLLQAEPVTALVSQPELLAFLRTNYIDYDKVSAKGDLTAMISSSRGSLSVASVEVADQRMYGTLLPNNIVYWRAASFAPATSWQEMTSAANGANATGLVLDLRSNATPDDFAGALRVARFLNRGETGLVLQKATGCETAGNAILTGSPNLVVLTDKQTRGAAEILAAVLQAHGALVMGEATAGCAAIFGEIPIRPGHVLRYTAAHVHLTNGTDLWAHPVVPDLTLALTSRAESEALALIDHQQVNAVISEGALRHRLNEAALVAGQDPEQDSFIAAHEADAPATQASATRDLALLQAMDTLTAIRALQGRESSPPKQVAGASSSAPGTMLASANSGR